MSFNMFKHTQMRWQDCRQHVVVRFEHEIDNATLVLGRTES